MNKIKQTYSGKNKGNCLAACISSLLEININDIPGLNETDGDEWYLKISQAIEKFGYYMLQLNIKKEDMKYIKGSKIIGVPSLNYSDQLHCIIIDEK